MDDHALSDPPPAVSPAAVARRFPDWTIQPEPGAVWSATRRDGTELRYIVGRSPAELAEKLGAMGSTEGRPGTAV
jgi:hypothetical protein